MSSITCYFLGVLANIRLLHWQTKSYARHIATDNLYSTLDGLVDQFVEAYMGRYGRISMPQGTTLELMEFDHPEGELDEPVQYLERVRDQLVTGIPKLLFAEEDVDLLNIRDEMVQIINKTLYLFTLS